MMNIEYMAPADLIPYSKVIVGVMKDINSGTFNPKLKVSRREMGI